jgi:acyl carrier protein
MNQPEVIVTEEQLGIQGQALRRDLASASATQREALVRDTVLAQSATILDHSGITADSNFVEQGLTSLKALELTRNLMTLTNVEIPLVAILEYPTPTQLAAYIVKALAGDLTE